MKRGAAVLALLALVGPALAQPTPTPTPTRTIAIAPLTMLGTEDTSATAREYEAKVAREMTALGGAKIVTAAEVVDATKKAKKPALRACDGEPACLSELGTLVGAQVVVFGEIGGLGDVSVLSLGSIDVAAKKETRRVQVALGQPQDGGVAGAVTRLLDPDRFVGQLKLKVSVDDASIYIDGKRLGKSPTPVVRLPVGTHALRVTHPEHRDYVRFVDINFGAATPVDIRLEKYAEVESSVSSTDRPKPGGAVTYVETAPRWYRQWWAVAGVAVLAIGGGVLIGAAIDTGLGVDGHGTVTPP